MVVGDVGPVEAPGVHRGKEALGPFGAAQECRNRCSTGGRGEAGPCTEQLTRGGRLPAHAHSLEQAGGQGRHRLRRDQREHRAHRLRTVVEGHETTREGDAFLILHSGFTQLPAQRGRGGFNDGSEDLASAPAVGETDQRAAGRIRESECEGLQALLVLGGNRGCLARGPAGGKAVEDRGRHDSGSRLQRQRGGEATGGIHGGVMGRHDAHGFEHGVRKRLGHAADRGTGGRLQESAVMLRAGRGGCVRDPAIAGVGFQTQRSEHGRAQGVLLGHVGHGKKSGEADLGIRILQQTRVEEGLRTRGIPRQHAEASPTHRSAAMPEGGVGGAADVGGLTRAQAGKGPQRMLGTHVEAHGIHRTFLGEPQQRGHGFGAALFNKEPLGVEPPELVVVAQGLDQLGRGRTRQVDRGHLAGLIPRDPIDPAVAFVAERRLVGVALAVLEPVRRRVVLDDVVVPIEHPHGAVRSDLRHDGRAPFVRAGEEALFVPRHVVRALALQPEHADQVTGGFGHKRHAVPEVLGIIACGVEGMARTGGVAAVGIHLADLSGDGVEILPVGDGFHAAGGPAVDGFVVAVRHRHVPRRVVVRRGSKHRAVLAESQAPGVVVARAHELQLRAVALEAVHAHAEPHPLPTHLPVESAVSDHTPDPVVRTVPQVRGGGMRVAHAPAFEEHTPFVGLVVPVAVLEEQGVPGLHDDESAPREHHARGDAQSFREHGELVRLAVRIRVLADLDAVASLARRLQLVRVIDRLGDPQAAAFVPRHADRLQDLGFRRPKFRPESRDGHDVPMRFRRRDRELHLGPHLALCSPFLARDVVRDRVR